MGMDSIYPQPNVFEHIWVIQNELNRAICPACGEAAKPMTKANVRKILALKFGLAADRGDAER